MGVYHCDCGETLYGETFECETCGRGDGDDGTIFCEDCAAVCCAPKEDQDRHDVGKDLALLAAQLRCGGVYTDSSQHAREKTIHSDLIDGILQKVIADPTGVAALLDEAEQQRPSKKSKKKKATKPAAADEAEVITIE